MQQGQTSAVTEGQAAMPASLAAGGAMAERTPVGKLATGEPVDAITLTNGHGICTRILAYGATLQTLTAPDRAGIWLTSCSAMTTWPHT